MMMTTLASSSSEGDLEREREDEDSGPLDLFFKGKKMGESPRPFSY